MKIGMIGEDVKEWNELNGGRHKLRIRISGLWYELVEITFAEGKVTYIKICKNDFLFQSFKGRLAKTLENVDDVEKMKLAVETEIEEYAWDTSDYYESLAVALRGIGK